MPVNPKSIKNLKPAQKGEVRNPHGAPKKLPDLETAMAQIMGEEKDGKTALDAILAALRAKAAKGDIRAAEVLLNRGYGLPKQTNVLTGPNGGPIQSESVSTIDVSKLSLDTLKEIAGIYDHTKGGS